MKNVESLKKTRISGKPVELMEKRRLKKIKSHGKVM